MRTTPPLARRAPAGPAVGRGRRGRRPVVVRHAVGGGPRRVADGRRADRRAAVRLQLRGARGADGPGAPAGAADRLRPGGPLARHGRPVHGQPAGGACHADPVRVRRAGRGGHRARDAERGVRLPGHAQGHDRHAHPLRGRDHLGARGPPPHQPRVLVLPAPADVRGRCSSPSSTSSRWGSDFVGDTAAQAAWYVLYLGTAALVVWFRLLVPVRLNLRHKLRVESVVPRGARRLLHRRTRGTAGRAERPGRAVLPAGASSPTGCGGPRRRTRCRPRRAPT